MTAPLRGSCSCGRNTYTIHIPSSTTLMDHANVFFSSHATHRRSYGTPLSSFLRIPLAWYQSSTHTLSPSPLETASDIRRLYHTDSDDGQPTSAVRYFCGFCGTPLGYWTDHQERGEWIDITLGSLGSSDLRGLEERGLVGDNLGVGERKAVAERSEHLDGEVQQTAEEGDEHMGISWFDDLTEGSKLERTRRTGERREGPGWRVEWEIVEWIEDEDEPTTAGAKRKLGKVESEDAKMDG
ncbi:hypothetical protein BJ878DRAFT_414095 [Calycina marina]|uniref:CENP-V/GFA domain-containing protein n=1 Tax=Calycina marina TaxID=1763456 RepID=A0A9P7Z935_9HELO|nr:hypothetical protein BJ878DRAFT_414095 [Calycina marina]